MPQKQLARGASQFKLSKKESMPFQNEIAHRSSWIKNRSHDLKWLLKSVTENSWETTASNCKKNNNDETYECRQNSCDKTSSHNARRVNDAKKLQKEEEITSSNIATISNDLLTYFEAPLSCSSSAIFEPLREHNYSHELHITKSYHDFKVLQCSANLNMFTQYVYRCEITNPANPDCCGCDSDLMTSAMQSLNECAKNKTCGRECKCILCGDPKTAKYVDLEKRKLICSPQKNILVLADLEGRSQDEKRCFLRRHALAGLPLPDGGTAEEQKYIENVQFELGLPRKPKNERRKFDYNQAFANGIITYLEGKTESEKEIILVGEAERGLPLPKGRTKSERKLIKKVKLCTPKTRSRCSCTSEARFLVRKNLIKCFKQRDCKKCKCMFCSHTANESTCVSVTTDVTKHLKIDAPTCHIKNLDILSALKYKLFSQREKLLGYRAILGITLPIGLTDSDRELIRKVRRNVGLPPVPENLTEEEKYNAACDAGLITPLEGKPTCLREKLLRAQACMGLPLPEGKDFRDKALKKVITTWVRVNCAPLPRQVKKVYRTVAVRLVPLLEVATPDEREIVFKLRALLGVPLPEGRTNSDRRLLDKVRYEVGLPPAPATADENELYEKAWASGIITPLEGKVEIQRVKLMKAQAKLGLCIPQGRTPFEIEQRRKIACKRRWCCKVPRFPKQGLKNKNETDDCNKCERLERREKLLICRALLGVPLHSEEIEILRTGDDEQLIKKVRKVVGLTLEPRTKCEKERYKKAWEAGIITPLEGKTPCQQEVILRAHAEMGLSLPKGRIPCEKQLVKKIKREYRKKPQQFPVKETKKIEYLPIKCGAQHIHRPYCEQNHSFIRGCVDMFGIPIPESLPVDNSACSCGSKVNSLSSTIQIESLECQSESNSVQTERSEDSYVQTDKIECNKVSTSVQQSSTRICDALITLDKKCLDEKEKIIRRLARAGLPIPEAESSSDKIIIEKVRFNLGLPPEPTTPARKRQYNKAFEDGLVVPLEGKSFAEKERLLRNLKVVGVQLPMGRTKSEYSLISSIESEPPVRCQITMSSSVELLHGVQPAEACGASNSSLTSLEGIQTDSESEKLKQSVCNFKYAVAPCEPKIIVENTCGAPCQCRGLHFRINPRPTGPQLLRVKLKSRARSPGEGDGLARQNDLEQFEDIIRSRSCDRGCGCDKKKIKFKDSYVQINVSYPELYGEPKIGPPEKYNKLQNIYRVNPVNEGIKLSILPTNSSLCNR